MHAGGRRSRAGAWAWAIARCQNEVVYFTNLLMMEGTQARAQARRATRCGLQLPAIHPA
jgi:hypothetical protein